MILKPLFVFPLVIFSVVVAMCFSGCQRRFGHGKFHGPPKEKVDQIFEKLSKELDLTQDQKKELTRIKEEINEKHKECKEGHRDMFDELLQQVRSDRIDEEVLSRLCEEKHSKMDDMQPFFISKFTEFHALLTPEQRNKLAEKMTECHEWRR